MDFDTEQRQLVEAKRRAQFQISLYGKPLVGTKDYYRLVWMYLHRVKIEYRNYIATEFIKNIELSPIRKGRFIIYKAD